MLTESALTFKQDEEVIIIRWIKFNKATINEESIFLSGEGDYFFPKKCMSIDEYTFLRTFISDKFQNEPIK